MSIFNGIEILKQFSLGSCQVRVANVEPLGANGALDDALKMLSHERREMAMRYRFERGKWLSAGAGLLLDCMLQEHGLREHDMQYAKGEHGKPYFQNYPQLHFNLSHSGTLVACALGNAPVGVDVQTIVTLRRSLVNFTMSEEEISVLDDMDNDNDKSLFFTKLWTLKESYAKATGTGLSHSFPSFKINDEGTAVPLYPLNPSATFKTLTMTNAVVSVAVLD